MPEAITSTDQFVMSTLSQCSTVNEDHKITPFHFSSYVNDSSAFDEQPQLLGGSDLTSAENKS